MNIGAFQQVVEAERRATVDGLWISVETAVKQISRLRGLRQAGAIDHGKFVAMMYEAESHLVQLYELLMLIDPLSATLVEPSYHSLIARRGQA